MKKKEIESLDYSEPNYNTVKEGAESLLEEEIEDSDEHGEDLKVLARKCEKLYLEIVNQVSEAFYKKGLRDGAKKVIEELGKKFSKHAKNKKNNT